MNGPHARVRYATLSELLRGEAATLAPVPYLARYQRGNQVIEVRLERLESGEAVALVHDVSAELGRQRELQREREALLHEERMHAMGVLASGVAHDLNHALNLICLRVATLRADPQLAGPAARSTCWPAWWPTRPDRGAASGSRPQAARPSQRSARPRGGAHRRRRDGPHRGRHREHPDRRRRSAPPAGPRGRGRARPRIRQPALHAQEQMRGREIHVNAREDRGRVLVTIRDAGEGLDEEDLARLFDPFSGAAGESALGLSIAWG